MKEEDSLEGLGMDGQMILKLISKKKEDGRACPEFWLSI
jgi:hypothetical protein